MVGSQFNFRARCC